MTDGKVAVPYYGRIHRPRIGYERIFFIVNPGGDDLDVSLTVWDRRTHHTLPEWLKNIGIASLVCREEPADFIKKTMAELGIKILGERNNDASRLMQALMV